MAYKVSIFNNGIETIVHYPTSDKAAPHLDKMDLKEKDNDVDSFSFSIPINNQGYTLLNDYKTKIKIIDTGDNSVRFTGRILNPTEKMDGNGFYKEVSCENALAYLLDSNARTTAILGSNLQGALQTLLQKYNATVEADKQIQLGTVDVTLNNIVYGCNFEPVLNAILNILKNVKEYHLRVRETNGVLYLDCLQSLSSNVVDVRLGENMKEIIKSKDISQLATRIIPLGANNLDISSVNGGVDYIEDLTAKGLYGVIEKTVSYSDITDATTLKNTAMADISNYTQPLLTLQVDALDLSKLTGIKANEFVKGMSLHIINTVMGIDTVVKIVECDVDLTKEYNPKLTLSNIPQTMQDIVSGLQNSSLSNDSTHRGVQVGDSFGIRVAGSKDITTISGDTFEMLRKSDNVKVLFADENGILNLNEVIAKDMRTSSDDGNTVLFKAQWSNYLNNGQIVMQSGFLSIGNDTCPCVLWGDSTKPGTRGIAYLNGKTIILGDLDTFGGTISSDGLPLATQGWVTDKEYVTSSALNNYVDKTDSKVNLPNGMYCICSGTQIDFYDSNGNKIQV